MDRSSIYYRQVQLLVQVQVQVLPFVAKHSCFALKGGTAIKHVGLIPHFEHGFQTFKCFHV